MDELQTLLLKSQTNLHRLRTRARYLFSTITRFNHDTHKQFGPYASFWGEWIEQIETLLQDVQSDILITMGFCKELQEFIAFHNSHNLKKMTKSKAKQMSKMKDLAKEALECQHDMLRMIDFKIMTNKEYANKLMVVETADNLNDD